MLKQLFRLAAMLLVLTGAVALGACGGSGSNSNMSGNGALSLDITDTPVEGASQVVVAFTGVDVMGPSGQMHLALASEKTVDLLTLQGNASASLLSGVTVPAGDYQWLRLDVDEANSFVVATGGGKFPLKIPSGSESGLKLVSGFTVAQGGSSDFVVDFDLRKSLTLDHGAGGALTYTLTPALRLTDMQQVGTVSGTVASTLSLGGTLITATDCEPAVYVYIGSGIKPEGYDVTVSGGTSPLTSAKVSLDATSGDYVYTVSFLAPGTYTLAAVCAGADTTGATTLAFSPAKTATVTANNTVTVNF